MNIDCYQALHGHAAWFDRSTRGKIRVTGEDRVRLLHAMTTNNINECELNHGCYAFFLNAQGRILADVNVFLLADHILLDTEPELKQPVMEHLDKFIIADDVTLEDVTERLATIAVEGHTAEEAAKQAGIHVPASDCAVENWGQRLVARVSETGAPGIAIYAPIEEKQELISELERAGVTACRDEEAITLLRLEHHQPKYGIDFGDTYIPQETQLMNAIHFAKGCYLGQEIVERVRSRGHLNKMLVPFEIESDHPYPVKTRVIAGDRDAGYLTSSAYSPRLGKVVALGQLRTEAFGKELSVEGAHATAVNLPAPTAKC